MVEFYVLMIRRKKMTIDEVPEKWKDAVEKALQEK